MGPTKLELKRFILEDLDTNLAEATLQYKFFNRSTKVLDFNVTFFVQLTEKSMVRLLQIYNILVHLLIFLGLFNVLQIRQQ